LFSNFDIFLPKRTPRMKKKKYSKALIIIVSFIMTNIMKIMLENNSHGHKLF